MGTINTLIFLPPQPDTVDYGSGNRRAYRGGQLQRALVYPQGGQGVGGAAAAYTIGLGGYVSASAVQSDAVLTSIRVAAGGLPALVLLAPMAVMLAYPLTEKALQRMVGEMAERRARRALGSEVDIRAAT